MNRILFTVTNDLNYDQRMRRICSSLQQAGYSVTLIGRKQPDSPPLTQAPFRQVRLHVFFQKGFLFYAEYNLRLFFYLLFQRCEAVCAIDLDTLLPCLLVSRLKGCRRIYDAHELFCEMKEVVTRPGIHRFWKWVERLGVPRFAHAYTVNEPIAEEFRKMYGIRMEVIRNMPLRQDIPSEGSVRERVILYQGAVNEGRSFETLIPAMKEVPALLRICGDGNFMKQAQALVRLHGVEDRVEFLGRVEPAELVHLTLRARIGITLFEKEALSNYYSLANRYFDYIQAGTPQVCVDYPVYRELNNRFETGVLVSDLTPGALSFQLRQLLDDSATWNRLHLQCLEARKEFCWQEEEKKLIQFYDTLFG